MAEITDYPKTGSFLDASTRTGLSTQIVITVNGEPVGAVQSFAETQSKTVRRVGEVGTDGFIEIIPQTPTTVSLELERVVFDGLSLTESLSRSWRNITSQRIPFDIEVIDQFTGTGTEAVITTYHNCWFERISKTYTAGDYVIVERGTVAVEFVSSLRNGQAVTNSQGVSGSREVFPPVDASGVEQSADTGDRRGALDAAGIISAAY